MKKLTKIIILIFCILFIFDSCKKEDYDILNNIKLKPNQTRTDMEMEAYGKLYKYAVLYDTITNEVEYVGKNIEELKKLVNDYKSCHILTISENKSMFFKYNYDMYKYLNSIHKPKQNVINNNERIEDDCGQIMCIMTLFKHANSVEPIKYELVDFNCTPTVNVEIRVPCTGSDLINSCYAYSVNSRGILNSWVGNSINDEISSVEWYFYGNNTPSSIWYGFRTNFYEDANFGGRAITVSLNFSKPNFISSKINNLKDFKRNNLLKTWNDAISSYQFFAY